MMGAMDGMLTGTTQDWSVLDMGEFARQERDEDAAFDRWLASLSPDALDHFLSDLHRDADALSERTA
jgi:hypothetical protein